MAFGSCVIRHAVGWRLLHTRSLYLACEGRIAAVVSAEAAESAPAELQTVAPQAALIGELAAAPAQVFLDTAFGGQRALDELDDDPLPRIC